MDKPIHANHITISVSNTNRSVSLPLLEGTLGPQVADIRKLHNETGIFTFDPGYGETASCESKITYIDGDAGVLLYRGYPIEQLAEKSTFLEVAYLLLNGGHIDYKSLLGHHRSRALPLCACPHGIADNHKKRGSPSSWFAWCAFLLAPIYETISLSPKIPAIFR